jgi:hypothetical protein
MKNQPIFIDDSGDPSFKPDSSSHFVLASAIFIANTDAKDYLKILKPKIAEIAKISLKKLN